ncbi:MAG: hypothetical protein HOC23_10125 [Halieaceae bacterium]|jgi:hypothetical protein|nr:hypothetical protein [Halieaceae bacterium]
MPESNPTTVQLVEAVCAFLENDVMPSSQDRLAFDTRVAVNALKIVARELRLGASLDESEQQRLSGLLGQNGSLDALNDLLTAQINTGVLDSDTPDLMNHLYQTTMGKLQIDNPRYSTYKRLHDKGKNGDQGSLS